MIVGVLTIVENRMPVLENLEVAQNHPPDSPSANESPKRPMSQRLILAALTVVVTLCLLEGLARVISTVGQYNPVTTDEFYVKKALAETPETGRSILFMGSSYTDRSIYADLLTERLQRSGYAVNAKNLAMLGRGGAPQAQLPLLQAAVKASGKPLAVFYDISPLLGFLAEREEKLLLPPENLPYLLTYREKLAALIRALPSVISAPDSTPPGVFGARQDHISAAGWNPNFGLVDRPTMDQSMEVRKKLIGEEKFGTDSFQMLAPIQDYCAQQTIPLIFVWYPTSRVSDDLYAEHGLPPQDFVRDCQEFAQKSGTSFLNLHSKMDRIAFSDCDHLNVTGAEALTEKMAQVIMSDPFKQVLPRSQQ
jgi:hypothetical protein